MERGDTLNDVVSHTDVAIFSLSMGTCYVTRIDVAIFPCRWGPVTLHHTNVVACTDVAIFPCQWGLVTLCRNLHCSMWQSFLVDGDLLLYITPML